jgi:hypothetical protein
VEPAGNGGGGSSPQLNAGVVNTAEVVVCARPVLPVRAYDQSHAVIVPGAVEVVPLKVQSSAAPPSINPQASVSVGPLTPKLAVATVGSVMASTAEAVPPPYDAPMVAVAAPPTALVAIENVALVDPAGTRTLAATVAGSVAVNAAFAPPAGAAALSVTVPVTVCPPTTLDGLNETADTLAPVVTVIAGD